MRLKQVHYEIISLALGLYLILSCAAIVGGIIDKKADERYPTSPQSCKTHTRIGLLFPAYKLGCYLGETVE